jgi:hypothetical protein
MGRTHLALGILALRQQVAVLKRKRPRPKMKRIDRLCWTGRRSGWDEVPRIVRPEIVVGWHRARGGLNRTAQRSSNECVGDPESTEKAFYCPDFRVTTWALCIDPPLAKLIPG